MATQTKIVGHREFGERSGAERTLLRTRASKSKDCDPIADALSAAFKGAGKQRLRGGITPDAMAGAAWCTLVGRGVRVQTPRMDHREPYQVIAQALASSYDAANHHGLLPEGVAPRGAAMIALASLESAGFITRP